MKHHHFVTLYETLDKIERHQAVLTKHQLIYLVGRLNSIELAVERIESRLSRQSTETIEHRRLTLAFRAAIIGMVVSIFLITVFSK